MVKKIQVSFEITPPNHPCSARQFWDDNPKISDIKEEITFLLEDEFYGLASTGGISKLSIVVNNDDSL